MAVTSARPTSVNNLGEIWHIAVNLQHALVTLISTYCRPHCMAKKDRNFDVKKIWGLFTSCR